MAASASLSSTFSLSSTRPANHLSLQKFIVPGKPILRKSFSSFPALKAYRKFEGYNNERRGFCKSFVSAQPENQPKQTSNEDGSGLDDFQPESAADKKLASSLKSLMQVYKAAILDGNEKTIYEVEDLICALEKEKNELAQKVSALSEEISSGKEKYVRLQADFDNYRKRSEKEKLTVRSDAQGEVVESLLPMVDSFERAKQQIKLETEEEKKIDASYQGIYKQFVEIMRSLRVAAVPTIGKPFDPLMHEAIAREESQEFKEGIIIQEFRRGFYLGDRLLRPAMVKVSSGPGKKKPSSVPEQPATVAGVDNR